MLKQIQAKAQKLFVKVKNRRTISLIVALLVTFVGIGFVFVHLGTGAEAAWWPGNGNQWVKRKNLELFNTTGESLAATTSVAITVNTKELVASGKLRQDCADLRVLYQPNTSTATEVIRHLIFPVGESCATSGTTKVYFPLQATLGASSKSYDYYMYFANPDAVAPTDTDRAFDIGSKQALLVCPFNGTTECAAGETPSTETGAIRFGGAKSALAFAGTAFNNSYINAGSASSLDNIFDNGAMVNSEDVIKCTGCSGRNPASTAALFDDDGIEVTDSVDNTTSSNYVLVRSTDITANLTNGEEYTTRAKVVATSGTADIVAARLIVLQTDTSSIIFTSKQIELGNSEEISSTINSELACLKYFYYDDDKYSNATTAYFDATTKGSIGGTSQCNKRKLKI